MTNNSQVLIRLSPHALSSQAVLKSTLYSSHRIVNDKQFSSVIFLSLHVLPSQRSLSQHCTRIAADKPISISLRFTISLSANIGCYPKPQTKKVDWRSEIGNSVIVANRNTPLGTRGWHTCHPPTRDTPRAPPRDVWRERADGFYIETTAADRQYGQ